MTQSYVLTLKTLKTLGLPCLCGLQQHFAGIVYDQHISTIVFSNWGPGCTFLLWRVVLLLSKCTFPPECGEFFLAQFEQHNLPRYLTLHKHFFVLVCFLFSFTLLYNWAAMYIIEELPPAVFTCCKLFLQFFIIFPKLSQYFSSSSVSCSYCGSLQPQITACSNTCLGEFEQNES